MGTTRTLNSHWSGTGRSGSENFLHIEWIGPGNYLWRWTEEYIYAYQTKFSEKYSAEWKAPFTYASSLLSENQEQGKAYLKIIHQSIPPAPRPPPPGNCGAFARLVSPGGGAFANFALPGAGHLPTPGPFPSFWHARGFLYQNITTKKVLMEKTQIGSSVNDRNTL